MEHFKCLINKIEENEKVTTKREYIQEIKNIYRIRKQLCTGIYSADHRINLTDLYLDCFFEL